MTVRLQNKKFIGAMSFAVHESAVGTYRTSLVALHISGCKIYFQFCLPVDGVLQLIILIFPSGTRSEENIAFKRGAATIALHARVPLVPAFFQGPKQMQVAHPATFGINHRFTQMILGVLNS